MYEKLNLRKLVRVRFDAIVDQQTDQNSQDDEHTLKKIKGRSQIELRSISG
jgi:hypothetical protein